MINLRSTADNNLCELHGPAQQQHQIYLPNELQNFHYLPPNELQNSHYLPAEGSVLSLYHIPKVRWDVILVVRVLVD